MHHEFPNLLLPIPYLTPIPFLFVYFFFAVLLPRRSAEHNQFSEKFPESGMAYALLHKNPKYHRLGYEYFGKLEWQGNRGQFNVNWL